MAEVWGELARHEGGAFETDRKGRESVRLDHRGWRVVLGKEIVQVGSTPQVYTRVHAVYQGARDLQVVVRERNGLDRILEALGFGRRRLPLRPALLEKYVVRGTPPGRVPSLFGAELTDALLRGRELRLVVRRAPRKLRKHHGDDAGEVWCRTSGVVLDLPRLGDMVAVVRLTLDSLERIAEARAPEG